MIGTHSINDDFRKSFRELLRILKSGGSALITGIFNEFDLDARIYWRYPSNTEGSWN